VVLAGLQLRDAAGVDVKTHGAALFAKFNSQRQTNVAQTQDGDGFVLKIHL
jgi:hypothetical protein